jgi:hypothetical protein
VGERAINNQKRFSPAHETFHSAPQGVVIAAQKERNGRERHWQAAFKMEATRLYTTVDKRQFRKLEVSSLPLMSENKEMTSRPGKPFLCYFDLFLRFLSFFPIFLQHTSRR